MNTESINIEKLKAFENELGCTFCEDGEYAEMSQDISGYVEKTAPIPNIEYGFFKGDITELKKSVEIVDSTWPQYFNDPSNIFCGYYNNKVICFCNVEDGEYSMIAESGKRTGTIGCVGTLPEFRGRGIGLRMVDLATVYLKEQGYNKCYISYTGIDHWYAKLGYKTFARFSFLKKMDAFQIDCGRMYFTKQQILTFAQAMKESGKDTLILAFGNEGFRFLLDDMSLTADGKTYESNQVKKAVSKGNKVYRDCGTNELTQSEMLEIFEFCNKNKIQIIPLFNTPGHMSALLTAMEELKICNVRYKNSKTTIDLTNIQATAFLEALINKYIKWFASQGCKFFHLGCDEYANDVLHNGFLSLQNSDDYGYGKFVDYVNRQAQSVIEAGLVPIMFNDGMYYGESKQEELLNPEIICAYWSKGWIGYELADAQKISAHGHKILNTNNGWYYVLGRHDGLPCNQDFTIEKALKGAKEIQDDELPKCGKMPVVGKVVCLWCDEPVELTDSEIECVKQVIGTKYVS